MEISSTMLAAYKHIVINSYSEQNVICYQACFERVQKASFYD